MQKQGSKHVKLNSDGAEFTVYGLSVEVSNAPLTPDGSAVSQFSATSRITLEVPLSFCGEVRLDGCKYFISFWNSDYFYLKP